MSGADGAGKDRRDAPLDVAVVDGRLIISIGVETLGFAAVSDAGPFDGLGLQIANADTFAHEVVRELTREEEDGTTPVHVLLDKAAFDAWEDGAEGITEATKP